MNRDRIILILLLLFLALIVLVIYQNNSNEEHFQELEEILNKEILKQNLSIFKENGLNYAVYNENKSNYLFVLSEKWDVLWYNMIVEEEFTDERLIWRYSENVEGRNLLYGIILDNRITQLYMDLDYETKIIKNNKDHSVFVVIYNEKINKPINIAGLTKEGEVIYQSVNLD
jgi:hypothetical protein